MPAIFNEKNRDAVRQKMLDNGFELLKRYGVKHMTVADIARSSGLAKGTFYTFFPSKEEFVYQIMVHKRNLVKQKYSSLVEQYGSIGRRELGEFFRFIRENDISIYQYLTEQDMNYLATKWPQEYSFDPQADETTTLWLLSHMRGLREGVNWKVLANFMKMLAIMQMAKDSLHEDALEETATVFRDGIYDYLFGPDEQG